MIRVAREVRRASEPPSSTFATVPHARRPSGIMGRVLRPHRGRDGSPASPRGRDGDGRAVRARRQRDLAARTCARLLSPARRTGRHRHRDGPPARSGRPRPGSGCPILPEPQPRHSAASIALAAVAIDRPAAETMVVVTTDHDVTDADVLRSTVVAIEARLAGVDTSVLPPLVTIAVRPFRCRGPEPPSARYGSGHPRR